jgi:hypothetical protein
MIKMIARKNERGNDEITALLILSTALLLTPLNYWAVAGDLMTVYNLYTMMSK